VWRWQPADPLHHPDAVTPQQLAFHELLVNVKKLGRYDILLMAVQDEIARQRLLVGPAEVLRGDLA